MKYLAGVAAIVALILGLVAANSAGLGPFESGLQTSLAPPTGLGQISAQHTWRIRPAGWIKSSSVRFSVASFRLTSQKRLQVQLVRGGASPSGNPTASGRPGQPSLTLRHLGNGTYRWWARFFTGKSISPWKAFVGGTAFGIDTVPPSAPTISSSTNPSPRTVSRSSTVRFGWSSHDGGSGIVGYWYTFGPPGQTPSAPHLMTRRPSLALHSVPTGTFVLDVRARDRAGNWSPASTYTVRVDSTPPTVTNAGFSTFAFNPIYNSMTLNYAVNRPSKIRIGIYGSQGHLIRLVKTASSKPNQILHYTWHGRDNQSRIVPPGVYNFFVRTTDSFGNSSVKEYSGLQVIDKSIVVSLSQQRLWAYSGRQLFLTSLVTTGNHRLPTPVGHYTILGRYHPFTFVSPFPKGSWDWYPPSKVEYAMLFRAGGYYIHDAPWRSVFGPGSNGASGVPGQNYTGTHGCVNVPANVAYRLFYWAPDGTAVIVRH